MGSSYRCGGKKSILLHPCMLALHRRIKQSIKSRKTRKLVAFEVSLQ